jgi:single-stranded DNA-binding protein
MLTVTGKLGSIEQKTFGENNTPVINGTFNIYGGTNRDNTPKPDTPIKFSAFGDQAEFISGNFKEGDIMRIVAEPKHNTYTSKEDPSKTSSYVSFTIKAVLDKDAAKDIYTSINEKCKAANGKNLNKQPDAPAPNAPAKAPKTPKKAIA